MLKEIERLGVIAPKTLDCWKFVPEDVVSPLISTDKAILFPDR